jgi:hypothetical protein
MSFTANDYVLDAAELYADTAYARIDADVWIKYLNAGIRALILVRPDAGVVTESVQLVAGTKQTIPTAALRLLDISVNQGTDGSTPGKIISPSKREHINYSNLLWQAGSGETYVENFTYDANTPNIYYVTPPVSTTTDVYVEMSTSQLPTTLTAIGNTVGVNDIFFEPLVQYMLYKAYSGDDESVEFQKAQTYFQNFFNLLGIEGKASQAQGPERKE